MSGCSRWNFTGGLPETSNCYCHPGIVGGSPAYARALAAVATFLRGLAKNAEQLTRLRTWRAILSRAFQAFLNGRLVRAPPRLAPT